MAATRPGNQERGWNDPPVFFHSSNSPASTQRRSLLNKRVAYPQTTTSTPAIFNPLVPATNSTSCATDTDKSPLTSEEKKLVEKETTSPQKSLEELRSDVSKNFNFEDDKEFLARVSSKMLLLLENLDNIENKISEDIKKRLEIFTDCWIAGNLSEPVKLKMALLSQALEERKLDQAHNLHVELMVDYVTEVGQWMVGVKRLIVESQLFDKAEKSSEEDT